MRRAAFGLLVATTLGGCNQIFGLDETTARPDAPDVIPVDGAWSTIHIGFLQLTLDPLSTVLAPVLTAFPDLTRLEVGTLDGPLVALTPDASGAVLIPLDITSAGPFRLVYQRTGDPLTHEYQGLVPDARVLEPLFGPVARTPAPAGGGWLISPTNVPPNHTDHRVFTVGTFTDGKAIVFGAGMPTLDYSYGPSSTSSMSGPLGATSATARGVLVDYASVGSCRCAIGSTDFPAGNLGPPHPTVTGVWTPNNLVARTSTTVLAIQNPADIIPFGDEVNLSQRVHYGFVPSDAMPSFTRAPDLAGRQFALRNPVMFSLRVCTTFDNNGAGFDVHDPLLFKGEFDRVLYTEVTVERFLPGGALVTNGVAVQILGATGFQVSSTIAFAKNVTVKSSSGTTTNLFEMDGKMLALGGVLTLTWDAAVETQVADFWDVTMMTVNGFAVTPKRVYTTTKREVKIQSADLEAGKTYILQISGYLGRPDAAMKADFGTASGNQAMSVIHTRTFVAQ
jgi:hypothetical protein